MPIWNVTRRSRAILNVIAAAIAIVTCITIGQRIVIAQAGPVTIGAAGVMACSEPGDVERMLRLMAQKDAVAVQSWRDVAVASKRCRMLAAGTRLHVEIGCIGQMVVRVRVDGGITELWSYLGEAMPMDEVRRRVSAMVGSGARC